MNATPPPFPRRLNLSLGVLFALLLLHTLWVSHAGQMSSTRIWGGDLLYVTVIYTCLFLTVQLWRTSAPDTSRRKALGRFALGMAFLAFAESYLVAFELRGLEAPELSVADVAYYLYYGLFSLALTTLWLSSASRFDLLTKFLDSVITVIGIGIFAWYGFISALLHQGHPPGVFEFASLSYVVLDLVVLGMLLLTLNRAALNAGYALLALGLISFVGADLNYFGHSLDSSYVPTRWPDALWTWGTVLQVLGMAYLPAQQRSAELADDRWHDRWTVGLMALPYVVVAASAALLIRVTHQHQHGPAADGVLYGTLANFGLMLLRQALTASHNRELATELREYTRQLEASHRQLEYEVEHDSLTGLPNRVAFQRRLHQQVSAHPQAAVAVMFIDLDSFKAVNDTFSHDMGDRVLSEVAQRWVALVPESVVLARLGGDEFMLFTPSHATRSAAQLLAQQLIRALSEPFDLDGYPLLLGASIGIAFYPSQSTSAVELQRYADLAMYQAKQAGKNRVALWDAAEAQLSS